MLLARIYLISEFGQLEARGHEDLRSEVVSITMDKLLCMPYSKKLLGEGKLSEWNEMERTGTERKKLDGIAAVMENIAAEVV